MDTIARDIMSTELLTVTPKITLEEALKLLVNSKITGLPVVDENGKLIGVVSEYDIITQISKAKAIKVKIFQQPIEFSTNANSIQENTKLSEIIRYFVESKYRRLPVVNSQGRLVGIITRRDLMRLFYYRSKLT